MEGSRCVGEGTVKEILGLHTNPKQEAERDAGGNVL